MHTTARNATLADLAGLLTDQQTRKLDVVATPTSESDTGFRFEDGLLRVAGQEAELTEDGVTQVDGIYRPTRVFDEGLAAKLGIPLAYVRRMRDERPDLYDANANGWLKGWNDAHEPRPADQRRFMLRLFRGDQGGEGIARAMLSDTYKRVDNLDVLTAALQGIRDAGTDVEVEGCDLSERSMLVRIVSPTITANMPVLLAGYRSPFRDATLDQQRMHWQGVAEREGQAYGTVDDQPVVWAGLVLRNSETGGGAFSITPRISVRVCKNGLVITEDALRAVHLGGKLDEGVVKWSDEAQEKNLALVTVKARDAVKTFLDTEYLQTVVARVEQAAGKELSGPAQDVVTNVGKALGFTEAQTQGVLDHFIRGGQVTAGGVAQAVTSYAQLLPDAEDAAAMEGKALQAMALAAK